MASRRLQAFSARCPVAQATTATQRAAHQAAYLAQWRQLAPTPLTFSAAARRRVLCWLCGLAALVAAGQLWPGPTHSLSLERAPVAWHRLAHKKRAAPESHPGAAQPFSISQSKKPSGTKIIKTLMKAPENPSPFVASELATFLSSLADEVNGPEKANRLRQAASRFQGPPFVTNQQKQELERLCAHPLLPKKERTLTLVHLHNYDTHEADERIRRLQSLISEREDMRDAA